jgi:hypothetical protein
MTRLWKKVIICNIRSMEKQILRYRMVFQEFNTFAIQRLTAYS